MSAPPLRFNHTLRGIVSIMALVLVSCGGGTDPVDITTAATTTDAPTTDAPTTDEPTTIVSDATEVPAAASLDAASDTATNDAATSVPATSVPEPATAPPAATPTTEIPDFEVPDGIIPVRIEIASIGVDAPTIDLSLATAEPEVPTDFDDTGWYTQTRLPGEIGPAVIAGHIDSRSGPAVFARLDELEVGDEITVYDEAGESRTFVVVEGNLYPKGDLPPGVFGFGQPEPELRLITCGGTFDESSGHYRDNYVVFARQKA